MIETLANNDPEIEDLYLNEEPIPEDLINEVNF